MTRLWIIALPVVLGLTACQSAAPQLSPLVAGKPGPVAGDDAHSGTLAFAQAACGGCHAVARGGLSPNSAAPPFGDIANREGLTEATLVSWLRDAHNYPQDMDFDLQGSQVDVLTRYILTLRDADYRAPIS